MLIVGENINTSRRRIAEAVEQQDSEFIVQVAKRQADAGAHFIDVNAGTFVDRETKYVVHRVCSAAQWQYGFRHFHKARLLHFEWPSRLN